MAFSNVRALKCPGLCNLRRAKSNSWLNNAQNLFIMILYELCARYNTIGFEELTKMEEPRTDRRVRKTKKQLRMALTTLMMEKSVGEITVREIAELADVNRGTFYAHYKDVYDLLTQLEETIFVRLEEISVINSSPDWDQSTYHYLEDVLKLCYDSADVYRALICRNNDMEFQQRLFETLKNQGAGPLLLLRGAGDALHHEGVDELRAEGDPGGDGEAGRRLHHAGRGGPARQLNSRR